MSSEMNGKVSTFFDGELDHDESLELIRQLDSDQDLRAQWRRYNLYSSAMRDELSAAISSGFSDRVLKALADEPVQLAPSSMPSKRRLNGPLAGFAVAASLVAIAIFVVQKPVQLDTQEAAVSSVAGLSNPEITPLPVNTVANSEAPGSELIVANSKNENVRERINRLLIEHNEYNPASDMTGMWSYSRFVGYNPGTDSH